MCLGVFWQPVGLCCDPTWILICPRASRHRWVGTRGKHADKYSRDLCLQCPSPTTSHSTPLFSQEITPGFRSAVRSADSYGDSALPRDPVHMKAYVRLSRMRSSFPPVPRNSCAQAPLAFNARCCGGSFSHSQILSHGDLTWGSELSLL